MAGVTLVGVGSTLLTTAHLRVQSRMAAPEAHLNNVTSRKEKQMVMNATSNWRVLAASTLKGDTVVNSSDEKLGTIEDLMIDLDRGRIAYAVLSFGGFLGMGDKLFAIPWSALTVDTAEKRFILNVKKEVLEKAPGFDKSDWPNMADQSWNAKIYNYYGSKPFWE